MPKIAILGKGAFCFRDVCIGYNYLTDTTFLFQINIKNPSHAKYVECIIPNRDLLAFTCEDKEDMNNFVNILRDQKNLKINVLHSGSEHKPFSSFKPSIPISDLR